MFGFLGDVFVAHEPEAIFGTVVAGAWVVGEYLARRATWLQGAPKKPSTAIDRGTYPIIALGVVTSLVADLVGFLTSIGGFLPWATIGIGIVIAGVGLGVRSWALRTLGRFFTMPITIAADHRIVRDGPYRWIRHPSYTGGFLTALGLAITIGSVFGVVLTFLACTAVYVYRIRLEEAALVSRFGEEYRAYAATTSRLLPKVY